MDIARVTAVRVLKRYRLWISLADGRKGEVDLSHLAGKGVFSRWDHPGAGAFENARVDSQWGTVVWPASAPGEQELDICPDVLAERLEANRADAA